MKRLDIAPTDFQDSELLADLSSLLRESIGVAFVAVVAGEFPDAEDPDFAEDLTRAARFVASVIVAQVNA